MKNARVLLCDDEEFVIKHFPTDIAKEWNELFEGEQIEIEGCTDIALDRTPQRGALPLACAGDYDLLLLDIRWEQHLVEPHGIKIATAIREKFPELPIVVFSAKVSLDDFKSLIPLGISGYVRKKGGKDHGPLCLEIRRVLGQSRGRSGHPLFQILRRSLAQNEGMWCADEVGAAATAVWKSESPYEKWDKFWDNWAVVLSKSEMGIPSERLAEFFAKKELLMLAVHDSFRGHLEHVLHVYFTGYVISHIVPGFRTYVLEAARHLLGKEYDAVDENTVWESFQVCWLMAATLHDVAYPVEMLPDVVSEASSIAHRFSFAEFSTSIVPLEPKDMNWASHEGKAARDAYQTIFGALYGESTKADIVLENAIYPDSTGKRRFNHGIVSGIQFLNEVAGGAKKTGVPKRFIQWTATAMAMHSLKHVGPSNGVTLQLASDPLSFLLSISDELQVWNRTRPDETSRTTLFKRVELADLRFSDNHLVAAIEYHLFTTSTEEDKNAATKTLSKMLERDQEVLRNYLDPSSFALSIQNKIVGLELVELKTLKLGTGMLPKS